MSDYINLAINAVGVLVVMAIVLIAIVLLMSFRRTVIYEYQRGLKYRNGRFKKILQPGSHWYCRYITYITWVDIRPRFITLSGQEVLSSDGVTLKVSIAAKYEITNPEVAVNKIKDYENALYTELQLAARGIIGLNKIDDLMEKRNTFGQQLTDAVAKKAEELGLRLISVDIKDIMFAGELKKTFAQVVKAQKEGQAALEKARGETAALRNLANAARMMEDNPALLQLRMIQQMGESSGNTLVVGLPQGVVPLKNKSQPKEKPEDNRENSES